jgi:hypothetical protein
MDRPLREPLIGRSLHARLPTPEVQKQKLAGLPRRAQPSGQGMHRPAENSLTKKPHTRPDTLMRYRIYRTNENSCNARPDHTFVSHLEQRIRPAGRLLHVERHVVDRCATGRAALVFAAMGMAVHHRAHREAVDRLGQPRRAEEREDLQGLALDRVDHRRIVQWTSSRLR